MQRPKALTIWFCGVFEVSHTSGMWDHTFVVIEAQTVSQSLADVMYLEVQGSSYQARPVVTVVIDIDQL